MKDFVSANPYITVTNLSACGDTPFLILACDGIKIMKCICILFIVVFFCCKISLNFIAGVWDVLTDYEAMDLILQR